MARAQWDLRFGNGVASRDLARLELNTEADRPYFVRIEQKPFLLTSRVELRPVQGRAAEAELRKCRQTVPLLPEEIAVKAAPLRWKSQSKDSKDQRDGKDRHRELDP